MPDAHQRPALRLAPRLRLGQLLRSTAPTTTADRACAILAAPCDDAAKYESRPPAYNQDRACAPVTVCAEGGAEFEAQAPTPNSDRICAAVCGACGDAMWEAQAPTAPSGRRRAASQIARPFCRAKRCPGAPAALAPP